MNETLLSNSSSWDQAAWDTRFQIATAFSLLSFLIVMVVIAVALAGGMDLFKRLFCCSVLGVACLRCHVLCCGCCKGCGQVVQRRAARLMDNLSNWDDRDDPGKNWLEVPLVEEEAPQVISLEAEVEAADFPPIPQEKPAFVVTKTGKRD